MSESNTISIAILNKYTFVSNLFIVKDSVTHYHSLRVSWMAALFCQYIKQLFGLTLEELKMAFYLHDIGKLGIDDDILKSREVYIIGSYEMNCIRSHPKIGAQMLADLPEVVRNIAEQHQEKLNGTGYPKGLKGDEISLEGKIGALIDAFDAIVSERPYKPKQSLGGALQRIKEGSGSHFDPYLVGSLNKLLYSNETYFEGLFLGLYPFGANPRS